MEGLNGVTNVDFMTPTQNGDFAQLSQPSLMFRRTNQSNTSSIHIGIVSSTYFTQNKLIHHHLFHRTLFFHAKSRGVWTNGD